MAVTPVMESKNTVVVYGSDGNIVYRYAGDYENVSGGGNTVLIDASKSQGCMIQLVFDENDNFVWQNFLDPRRCD